jgi:hypothetical protein
MPAIEPQSRDDWKRFCRRVSVQAQFFTLDDVCLWTQSKSCEHICCVCRYTGKVPGVGLSEGRAGCRGLGDSGLGAVAVVETASHSIRSRQAGRLGWRSRIHLGDPNWIS